MTEAEAAKLWCPLARVVEQSKAIPAHNRIQGVGDGGREVGLPTGSKCIGAGCMAWRWMGTHIDDPDGGPDLVWSTRAHGTCGLAGPWHANQDNNYAVAQARREDVR